MTKPKNARATRKRTTDNTQPIDLKESTLSELDKLRAAIENEIDARKKKAAQYKYAHGTIVWTISNNGRLLKGAIHEEYNNEVDVAVLDNNDDEYGRSTWDKKMLIIDWKPAEVKRVANAFKWGTQKRVEQAFKEARMQELVLTCALPRLLVQLNKMLKQHASKTKR